MALVHQSNFNVGAVSEKMAKRLDFEGRSGSLARAENSMLSFEGQARRRGGMVFRHGYPGNGRFVEGVRTHRDAPWIRPWLGVDGEGDLIVALYRRGFSYGGNYDTNKAYVAFMWPDGAFVTDATDRLEKFGDDEVPAFFHTWSSRSLEQQVNTNHGLRVKFRFKTPKRPVKAGEMLVVEEPSREPAAGYDFDSPEYKGLFSLALDGEESWGGIVPAATLIVTDDAQEAVAYWSANKRVKGSFTNLPPEQIFLDGNIIIPRVLPLYSEAAFVEAGVDPTGDRGLSYRVRAAGLPASAYEHLPFLKDGFDVNQLNPNSSEIPYKLPGTGFPIRGDYKIGRVVEIETPYDWEHVHATTDTPGIVVEQGRDEMTFTHPSYPVHKLVRDTETSWHWEKYDFSPAVNSPRNIRLVNETKELGDKAPLPSVDVRSNSEGYAPSHAETIDLAVVAYRDDDGESYPGVAARDARIEEEPGYVKRAVDATEKRDIVLFTGYDHFANLGGLGLRIRQEDMHKLEVNEYVALFKTKGTRGIEGRRYRVKAIIGKQPGSRDSNINIDSAVKPQLRTPASTSYRGPWVIITPEPESERYSAARQKLTPFVGGSGPTDSTTDRTDQNNVRRDEARVGRDYESVVGDNTSGADAPWERSGE